jgi:hypothetical protein
MYWFAGYPSEVEAKKEDSNSMSVPRQLRFLTVFSPATPQSIDMKIFEFLCVLDLEELSDSTTLHNHLRCLIHLRYLSLRHAVCIKGKISRRKASWLLVATNFRNKNEIEEPNRTHT